MGGKLLNFNRFMSNLSTKLVGAFVPVIVYKLVPTHKMQLALLTCAIQYLLSYLFNIILKKWLVKAPQIFLFLRILPIILYEVLLIFVDKNPVLCVIGIGLGYSLSNVFRQIPTEVLFAYNNATKKSGTGVQLALSKLIEQSAIIVGTIVGGLALDYYDMNILIIISLVIYFIGALPMLINYFRNRKESVVQEYSTYAHITLKEQSIDTKHANKVSTKITKTYSLFYFFQECYNAMYILLPLLMFTVTGTFTEAAIAGALFDGTLGISCFLIGKLEHKKDITALAVFGAVMVGILGVSTMFITEKWLLYVIIVLFAICYSMAYIFMYNRLLMKCKIVGRSTTCVINKINMHFLSTFCMVSVGLFLPLVACFAVSGGMVLISGVVSPYVEERTRRILVDHLEDNEIKDDYSLFCNRRPNCNTEENQENINDEN